MKLNATSIRQRLQKLEWDFTYDGVTFNPDTQTGPTSGSNTYLDGPAQHTVAVRVRDDDFPSSGSEIGEGIDTLQITVLNVAPQVNASGPYLTQEAQPITFTGVATDVGPDLPGLTYEWDLFSDGSPITTTQSVNIDHVFPDNGNYVVTLTVDDGNGGFDSDTIFITIQNVE